MSDFQDVQSIGLLSVLRSVWFTRPNDTTAYATGEVISDSTAVSKIMFFSECARKGRGSGAINQVMLIDGASQATKLSADLFLFRRPVDSYGVDNAAFTPTDEELGSLVAVVSLDGTTAANLKQGDATSGVGGNVVIVNTSLSIPFECAATPWGDDALFGVLVARNAYTPVASETFRVILSITQD